MKKLSTTLPQLKQIKLRHLWNRLSFPSRPSDKTLERLALLSGFQSWKDLQQTINGETDGQVNVSASPSHRKASDEAERNAAESVVP